MFDRSGAAALIAPILVAACAEHPRLTDERSIQGTIAGLKGSGLVLLFDGSDLRAVNPTDTTFQYAGLDGSSYSVAVLAQPTRPSQTCVVENGIGTLQGADVTNVAVTCTTNTYSVGGAVKRLLGIQRGLTLELNGKERLPISAAGHFAFASPVESASSYSVRVAAQPALQTCSVSGGSGAGAVGAADVESVVVDCSPDYTPNGVCVLSGPVTEQISVTAHCGDAHQGVSSSSSSYALTLGGPSLGGQFLFGGTAPTADTAYTLASDGQSGDVYGLYIDDISGVRLVNHVGYPYLEYRNANNAAWVAGDASRLANSIGSIIIKIKGCDYIHDGGTLTATLSPPNATAKPIGVACTF